MAVTEEFFREERLNLWDRLIRGAVVREEELEGLITKLTHSMPVEERAGAVLLLATAKIAREDNRAMRRNIVAALRYWFSQTGTKERPVNMEKWRCRNFARLDGKGLLDFMGLYLSWSEAMCSVRANPNDYSALKRVKERLQQAYNDEWERIFGSQAPRILSYGR